MSTKNRLCQLLHCPPHLVTLMPQLGMTLYAAVEADGRCDQISALQYAPKTMSPGC